MNVDEELRCISMEGARKIIYNAASVPSYYTGAYILRNKLNEEIPNIYWVLNNEGNSNYPTLSEINGYKALLANPVFIKDFESHARNASHT